MKCNSKRMIGDAFCIAGVYIPQPTRSFQLLDLAAKRHKFSNAFHYLLTIIVIFLIIFSKNQNKQPITAEVPLRCIFAPSPANRKLKQKHEMLRVSSRKKAEDSGEIRKKTKYYSKRYMFILNFKACNHRSTTIAEYSLLMII